MPTPLRIDVLAVLRAFVLVVSVLGLIGCVTSVDDSTQDNPFDAWNQGSVCKFWYYPRNSFSLADSGTVCGESGQHAEPVGHTRKLVADNCGESLQLVDYRVVYGCRNMSAPVELR
jgi:hypothetical protein